MKRVITSATNSSEIQQLIDLLDKAFKLSIKLEDYYWGYDEAAICEKCTNSIDKALQYATKVHGNYSANSSTKVVAADGQYPKGYFDDYYGQTAYEEYGDLVARECAGMIISKRAADGEEPGGLIYEAERLGIDDFFDLLKCLEGMCYNGKAVEISDYQYRVN